ncbi:MAG: single-stranded DNA-binding protein [Shewanella sp.]
MASINKVIIIGTLGKDPEIRTTQDGKRIANLSVATSESWKDKYSGEKKERTEWHKVVIFSDGLSSVADQYLKKGDKVYVEGQMQTRKWTDKDGVERYSTEIVLQGFNANLTILSSKKPESYSRAEKETASYDAPTKQNDLNDEIPF